MTTHTQTTQPVGFINFHDVPLMVLEYQGIEYVGARPLVALGGSHWKSARQTLLTDENVRLYGTKLLPEPRIALRDVPKEPKNDPSGSASTPQNAVLCIELQKARMYLARINTAQMRVQGNVEGADKLLALQQEWAKVLHDYETRGIAIKTGRNTALKELMGLIKCRGLAEKSEKAGLTWLIKREMAELDIPESYLLADDSQQALGL